jgi:hypothetical protein
MQLLLLTLALVAFFKIDLWLTNRPGDWFRPERALTALSLLGGFVLLTWQLNRQHQNALDADAQKARNDLRLAIYRDIARVTERASRNIGEMTRAHLDFNGTFFMLRRFGRPLDPGIHTHAALHAKLIDAERSIIAVIASVEKWEIALGPEFHGFKTAFSNRSAEVRAAFAAFMTVAMPYLPPLQRQPESDAVHEKLEEVSNRAWLAGLAWGGDLWDLRIALQNRMLGGLFDWRIPPREPTDPASKATVVPSD